MKSNVASNTILSVVCCLALSSGVIAQPGDAPPIAGRMTLGVTTAQTEVIATGWRAAKLIHAPVYNDSNQRIGKIDDLIIAPDGSLSVAVVNVGGFLGMGTHRVAIPVEQFAQISPKIVLPHATKDALKGLPEFKYT